MLDEQIDSVITDSIMPVSDSVVFPASLLRETVSWNLSTVWHADESGGISGRNSFSGENEYWIISSILIYTVVYLVFIALLRLRGRGFLPTVYTYFSTGKEGPVYNRKAGFELLLRFLVG